MTVPLPDPGLTEAEWIRRCQAGDRLAWRWLYERHFPRVFRLAVRMGVPEREAGDVCQEVFLRVFRSLPRFRGEAQIGTWIFRITLNEVRRSGRLRGLRQTLSSLLGREPTPAPALGPDHVVERAEAYRELEGILAQMRPKRREAFVLFELEELTLEEAGEVLGCGMETAKSRLKRARVDFERLRRRRALIALPGGKS